MKYVHNVSIKVGFELLLLNSLPNLYKNMLVYYGLSLTKS